MADITLSYKGSTIATMSASGSKTIQTKEKYCEDDIGLTYVKKEPDIIYNPDFNINTTELLSWDASNSGTGEYQGVRIIDGWYLMNSIATQSASGLRVTPKQANALLLQEINSYFVGKTLTLSASVDNVEYHITDTLTGTTSMEINATWGAIYVYSYGTHRIFVNIRFVDNTDIPHIVNNVSLKVA